MIVINQKLRHSLASCIVGPVSTPSRCAWILNCLNFHLGGNDAKVVSLE